MRGPAVDYCQEALQSLMFYHDPASHGISLRVISSRVVFIVHCTADMLAYPGAPLPDFFMKPNKSLVLQTGVCVCVQCS